MEAIQQIVWHILGNHTCLQMKEIFQTAVITVEKNQIEKRPEGRRTEYRSA